MNRFTQKIIAAVLIVLVSYLPVQAFAGFCNDLPQSGSHSDSVVNTNSTQTDATNCHIKLTTSDHQQSCMDHDCAGQHVNCSQSLYLPPTMIFTSSQDHLTSSALSVQHLHSITLDPDYRPPIQG